MPGKFSQLFHIRNLFKEIKVKDVMTSPVVMISENAELSEAILKFIDHGITHLIVADASGKLSGILTQKYLYKAHAPRKMMNEWFQYHPDFIVDGNSFYEKSDINKFSLKKLMKSKPFSLTPAHSIVDAIVNMYKRHIGAIPVVNKQQKVVGIITEQEIVGFIAAVLSA